MNNQRGNREAVFLISGAHLYSHWYILLLPPLFPLLKDTLGVSFTELGLSITVFSLVTGFTQAPIGFLVDRIGARMLLIAAVVVQSLAFIVFGLAPSYLMLMVVMAVAGLANAVYHPADYAILNASVDESRMGRAFSIHTASGLLGAFLAPAITIPLAGVIGWEYAVTVCAASGLAMAALLVVRGAALRDVEQAPAGAAGSGAGTASGMALLLSAPVLMGFLFYVGLSAFGHGVGDFSIAALDKLYEAPMTALGVVLGAWLLGSPIGVLAGGGIADRISRHDLFTAGALVALAVVLFVVAGFELPLWGVGAAFLTAGLLNGIVTPSRDMLIRAMTPPGQMGKVFGFVSTGFNVAGVAAPPAFGYLLDYGDPQMLFWVAGVLSLLTVPTVLATGFQGRRAHARLAGAS